MSFATTVLIRGNSGSSFSMSKNSSTDHLIVDLELRGHKLNQAHLVDAVYSRFLGNFDVRNRLPGSRGEADAERNRAKERIDLIQCRIKASRLVVGETETRRFASSCLALSLPRVTIFLRGDVYVDESFSANGG